MAAERDLKSDYANAGFDGRPILHGFAPFVVAEACGDRDAPPQEANLFDLQAKYAEFGF